METGVKISYPYSYPLIDCSHLTCVCLLCHMFRHTWIRDTIFNLRGISFRSRLTVSGFQLNPVSIQLTAVPAASTNWQQISFRKDVTILGIGSSDHRIIGIERLEVNNGSQIRERVKDVKELEMAKSWIQMAITSPPVSSNISGLPEQVSDFPFMKPPWNVRGFSG